MPGCWSGNTLNSRKPGLLGEMAGSRSGQEVSEMILKHPVPADSEEAIRDSWGHGQRPQEPACRGPLATEGLTELL